MDGERDDTLPPGWAWASLEDVCDVIGGVTVDAGRRGADLTRAPYLRVANVQRGHIDLDHVKSIEVTVAAAERLKLRRGDILLNEGGDRDKVGRGWVWEGQVENCIFQNHVFRARPRSPGIDPYFISHYLNEKARGHFLAAAKQTTNLASLSLTKAKGTQIALPPSAEQNRIAKALAELFEAVDEAEASVERARELAVAYRASLLHAACTGALTADWRAANPNPKEDGPALLRRILASRRSAWEHERRIRPGSLDTNALGNRRRATFVEPLSPAVGDLPPLPEHWCWASVDQLTDFRGNGTSRKPTTEQTPNRILRISAVRSMTVDERQHRFLKLGEDESLDTITTETGNLLFTRYSGSEDYVGVCGVLRSPPILFPDKLMRAIPSAVVEGFGDYLEVVLNGGESRRFIASGINTTAGQKGVAGSTIRACPVPLPPKEELQELSRRFHDAASILEEPSDDVQSLRQSILHAAFTGQLVPQDPADESADALLARLRAGTDVAPFPRARRPRQKVTA